MITIDDVVASMFWIVAIVLWTGACAGCFDSNTAAEAVAPPATSNTATNGLMVMASPLREHLSGGGYDWLYENRALIAAVSIGELNWLYKNGALVAAVSIGELNCPRVFHTSPRSGRHNQPRDSQSGGRECEGT